jgi:iron complex outermembrane recepter protein
LIGTDYFYSFYNHILSANGSFPINIYAPIYGTIPYWEFASAAAMAWQGTADQFTSFSAFQVRQLGVYAQDSITLFDNLHILVGGRYDLADQHSAFESTYAADQAAYNISPDAHNHAASPRVGVNFEPVPWIGFYGSYTRSFGINNGFTSQGNVIPPETAVGWEGGVKTKLLDERLTTTLAFFDITRSNVVTPLQGQLDPLLGRGIGLVRSQGVELDTLGKITNDLSVIASYAHIDEKVIQDIPGPQSLLGNTLDNVPANSGSLFLTYAFPTDNVLHGWRAGGGVYAVGKRWGDDQDTFYLPAYARLDAFASYAQVIGPTKWTLQVNVKNITNVTYYSGSDTFYNYVSSFRTGIFTGTPRTVTVSLRAEF